MYRRRLATCCSSLFFTGTYRRRLATRGMAWWRDWVGNTYKVFNVVGRTHSFGYGGGSFVARAAKTTGPLDVFETRRARYARSPGLNQRGLLL